MNIRLNLRGRVLGSRRLALVVFGALALGACEDLINDPVDGPPDEGNVPPVSAAPHTAVVAWNELARNLVAVHSTSPPVASRAYALLSVAQYDALKRLHDYAEDAGDELDAVAVSTASAAVLAYLYAVDANSLAMEVPAGQPARVSADQHSDYDISAAISAGKAAAEKAIERARTDGSDADWETEIPTGEDKWFSSLDPAVPPLLPGWGEVRPWLMESGSQFRSPPPPEFGSAEFVSALEEVREYSDNRTAEQVRIAEYWADGPGTATPPGHWNEIASELIEEYRPDATEAARVLAYMNMAVMDAGIACWDAKYTYWLIRPTQVDPEIELAVELPNFPSYTSGHSSFSGAASEVLSYFFPAEREELEAMGDEAALSRLYGGIHYLFDNDRGLEQGRAVAQLAIEKAEMEAAAQE